jgi:hypothetical protein
MSRTHRPSIARHRLFHANRFEDDSDFVPCADPDADPADVSFGDVAFVTVLADIVRQHRWQLVAAARRNLRGRQRRVDAEDVVQEVCSDAVDGTIALPVDAPGMLDELLKEVVSRCRAGGLEER